MDASNSDETSHVRETVNNTAEDGPTETETFLTDGNQVPNDEDNVSVKLEFKENYKGLSLFKRIKVDHAFRRRFTHTLWLFWAFVGLGWMVGQMGPSFPDLRLIAQQDIDTAAWLFTIFSFGYMIGSFGGGILYDNYNKLLLIVASIVIMAVFTAVLPWCELFPVMLAVRFISGLGAGGLDTGGNADLVSLWDEEGRPYMQALHFCFGFGGILSPLVTEPFLAKKECVYVTDDSDMKNISSDYTSNTSLVTNSTSLLTKATENVSMTTQNISMTTDKTCIEEYGQSYIHFSYMISFVIIGSSAVGFIYMYFKSVCKKKERNMAADKSNIQRPDKLSVGLKAVFLVLLFLIMMTYCAMEDTFSGFLATFCISHLHWSKGASSFATSLHWSAFSVGRFSGIFLIKIFKPVQLLFAYLIFLMCGFVGLLIASVTMTSDLIWVFIAFVGFSMSIVFPCLFTWTEESILQVSGKISSMFLIAASSGLTVNPLFLGYLMDNVSTIFFVYVLLAESILCFSVFIILLVLVKKFVVIPKLPPISDMEITIQPPE